MTRFFPIPPGVASPPERNFVHEHAATLEPIRKRVRAVLAEQRKLKATRKSLLAELAYLRRQAEKDGIQKNRREGILRRQERIAAVTRELDNLPAARDADWLV